jgi:hypothetical protein
LVLSVKLRSIQRVRKVAFARSTRSADYVSLGDTAFMKAPLRPKTS